MAHSATLWGIGASIRMVGRATGVMVKTVGVEFFCYHRDRPGSVALRDELLEQHCSYMDRYQAEMIARGPTLAGTCEEG